MGEVWHLPTVAAESTRALAERIGRRLELDRVVRVARVPRIALRALGLFSPMMREVAEMTYQWDVPYVLDDTKFRAAFGVEPTPIEEQVDVVARWGRDTFGARAAA
jgi:hypothetical protein